MNEQQFPDPRCPKCGYTMCELFDYRVMTPSAFSATANGKYQCYRCTPITTDEARRAEEARV